MRRGSVALTGVEPQTQKMRIEAKVLDTQFLATILDNAPDGMLPYEVRLNRQAGFTHSADRIESSIVSLGGRQNALAHGAILATKRQFAQ